MIFGAFLVVNCPALRAFVDRTNRKLSLTNVLFSGKLSVVKHEDSDYLIFNMRFFLFNPSLLLPFYRFVAIRGLRKSGYSYGVKSLNGVAFSELLEVLL